MDDLKGYLVIKSGVNHRDFVVSENNVVRGYIVLVINNPFIS